MHIDSKHLIIFSRVEGILNNAMEQPTVFRKMYTLIRTIDPNTQAESTESGSTAL